MADWSWKPNGKFETRRGAKKHELKQKKLDRRARRKIRKEFWDTPEWLRLRYEVLQRHGARCQCCGATRADGVQIHVDHIKPRAFFPDLALEESNLQVLCGRCNLGKAARDDTDWR